MAAWKSPKQMVILPRTPPPPPGEEPDPVAVVKAMAALREKGDRRRGRAVGSSTLRVFSIQIEICLHMFTLNIAMLWEINELNTGCD